MHGFVSLDLESWSHGLYPLADAVKAKVLVSETERVAELASQARLSTLRTPLALCSIRWTGKMLTIEFAAIQGPSVSADVVVTIGIPFSRAGTEERRLVTVAPYNSVRSNGVYTVDLRRWE
jgi:hypothetical protein